MPLGEKRGTVLLVIVDLAVKCNPNAAVLIRHRLAPRRAQVDDAQPAVSEHDAVIVAPIQSRCVRAAVNHGVAHATDIWLFVALGCSVVIQPNYAAHVCLLFESKPGRQKPMFHPPPRRLPLWSPRLLR
jgi:hypothetical protein